MVLSAQIVRGSLAFARDYLVDNELHLPTPDTQFKNDEEAQHWVRYCNVGEIDMLLL